jgi:hypothetical protein
MIMDPLLASMVLTNWQQCTSYFPRLLVSKGELHDLVLTNELKREVSQAKAFVFLMKGTNVACATPSLLT